MYVKLHQNIIRNEGVNYDEYEFAIYLAVRMIMKDGYDKYYISLNQIITTLVGGEDNLCSNTRLNIRNAFIDFLNNLSNDKPSIKVLKTLDNRNNSFYADLSDFDLDSQKEKYTNIDFDEVHKILNLKGFNNRFGLLRYFCVLISTMEKEGDYFIGKISMDFIRNNLTDISSKNTQIRYNNLLYINKLIYISNIGMGKVQDNKFYTMSNIYGRYNDKNFIKDYAGLTATNNKNTIEYRADVNAVRSLKQKITYLKKGYDYSMDQILDIRQSAEIENARCDKLIELAKEKSIKEKYNNKKIDMSIFDKYSFTKEESYE